MDVFVATARGDNGTWPAWAIVAFVGAWALLGAGVLYMKYGRK